MTKAIATSIAIMLLVTASSNTLAQSDFALTFDIPDGVNCTDQDTEGDCSTLELDVNIGSRYVAVNGAIMTGEGQNVAFVEGTCTEKSSADGFQCILDFVGSAGAITLDLQQSLDGSIATLFPAYMQGIDDTLTDSSSITLETMEQ